VLLYLDDGGWKISDLDTVLPCPCSAEEYLSASFIPTESVMFSVVDADSYIKYFASDRRHMKGQPKPSWDTIGSGFNLWEFVDGQHGRSYELDKMHAEFGE